MLFPEVQLLQAVIVLAEELNFSRAAQRLHVQQSTLSRQILKLESRINQRLFVRNHQNVELTDAGRHFVAGARIVLLDVEQVVSSVSAVSHGAEELLNIGKSAYTDPFLVTILQMVRLPLFPGLKVKFWSNYSHELAQMVMSGKLDMALVTAVPDVPNLSFQRLVEAPFYIALPKEIPLANHRELRLEDLHDREWILFAPYVNPRVFDMILAAATEKDVSASDLHYVMTAEEAAELIRNRKGVAFLPRDAAWRIASDGIAIRLLKEDHLKLVTKLITRLDNKPRLLSEFVRAAGRRWNSISLLRQNRLPLTG
jgi:DNA-binding transcriptional LysR family regulator